jgi:hypothetical protein
MAYGSVLTDVVQSSTTGTPPQFNDGSGTQVGTLCRAWVNFNGVTTATIRASFNVSSVTRNGTGDYTVNFTNAMSDANYATNLYAYSTGANNLLMARTGYAPSTASIRLGVYNTTPSLSDVEYINVAIFR